MATLAARASTLASRARVASVAALDLDRRTRAPVAPDAGVAAAARLAIEPLRDRPAEALPAPESNLDVDRIDLHRVGAGAGALGGNEGCPRAAERLGQRLTTPQGIADGGL